MIKSVADLCVNLAEAIVSSKVNSLAAQYYGRGLCVMVGGYGSDEDGLTESNAPFAWIYPDGDDQNVFADQLTSAKVNICVGLSIVKDLPSFDVAIQKAGFMAYAVRQTFDAIDRNVSTVGTQEYEDARDEAEGVMFDFLEKETAFVNALSEDDFETAAAKKMQIDEQYDEWMSSVDECIELSEGHEAAHAEILAAKATDQEKHSAFDAEFDSIQAKMNAHDDDPYYREVRGTRSSSSGQVVIYGGFRMFEALRKQLIDVIKNGAFGLPVKDVKMSQNSTSHYPLDWSQISVTFGEPESL